MNLDQRLRRALERPASGWPDEAGAYDRFLRRRRRHLLRAGAAGGLGLVLVAVLAVIAPRVLADRQPTVNLPVRPVPAPVPAPGPPVVTRASQGFQLRVPTGWQVDQRLSDEYRRAGQDWLVLRPVPPPAGGQQVTITVGTVVLDPREYPAVRRPKPDAFVPFPPGQTGTSLSGRITYGKRRDGRLFALGDQGSLLTYMVAWPYRCAPGTGCPGAAHLRALKIEAQASRASLPLVRRLARELVETVRPITNAVPGGQAVPESPGLFARQVVKVGAGVPRHHTARVTLRYNPPDRACWPARPGPGMGLAVAC